MAFYVHSDFEIKKGTAPNSRCNDQLFNVMEL